MIADVQAGTVENLLLLMKTCKKATYVAQIPDQIICFIVKHTNSYYYCASRDSQNK